MRGLTEVHFFALCVFCLVSEPDSQAVGTKTLSIEGARIITIGYLLDGNGFKYANEDEISRVQAWLQKVQYQAQLKLMEELNVNIKFQIEELNLTDAKLSEVLLSSTSVGSCGSGPLMHAGTVLGEIKSKSKKGSGIPNIICVITKEKIYQGNLTDLLGYTMNKTLCYTTVPMLLTYDRSQGRINETGSLFSELVVNSTSDDIMKAYAKTSDDAKTRWKQYFNVCNKKNNKNKYSRLRRGPLAHPSQLRT
uniref:Putative lipocalin n=1 Tax=Ixodes ricinus TaxID=34613 RepID=A0A6B0V5Q8_IXORI